MMYFHIWDESKEHPHTGNGLYMVCAMATMAKQLGIPTHFLKLSCADLRLEEPLHIINKWNNLGISGKEKKDFSY